MDLYRPGDDVGRLSSRALLDRAEAPSAAQSPADAGRIKCSLRLKVGRRPGKRHATGRQADGRDSLSAGRPRARAVKSTTPLAPIPRCRPSTQPRTIAASAMDDESRRVAATDRRQARQREPCRPDCCAIQATTSGFAGELYPAGAGTGTTVTETAARAGTYYRKTRRSRSGFRGHPAGSVKLGRIHHRREIRRSSTMQSRCIPKAAREILDDSRRPGEGVVDPPRPVFTARLASGIRRGIWRGHAGLA